MYCAVTVSLLGVALVLVGCGGEAEDTGGNPPGASQTKVSSSTTTLFTSITTTTTTTTTSTTTSTCPSVPFSGSKHDTDMCFCQMAGNEDCKEVACQCPQGCQPLVKNEESATIANIKSAEGCTSKTALLTMPKMFSTGLTHANEICPDGLAQLLTTLLQDGFLAYQSNVSQEPVMQCIHKEEYVSVPYLHLHTICANGTIDEMPDPNDAYCGAMANTSDAGPLAERFIKQLNSDKTEHKFLQ